MANKIELKDFSVDIKENEILYKLVKDSGALILDTSICEVINGDKEIKPILEIRKTFEEKKVEIQTFGFVGRFSFKKQEFDITYRFGEKLLDRMISIVNDFEIDVLEYESIASKKQSDNLAMKILYINFIFKLKKLSILGLPKSYVKKENHSTKFKGQIDINRFIRKDIPFQGKISSNYYEQIYVQEIVDVLYSALQIIQNNGLKDLVAKKIFQIKNLIYNHATKHFVNGAIIDSALHHKSIQNSLYKDFKSLIEIASYIIRYENKLEYKSNNILNGIVLDVSILWEKYLYTLLKKEFERDNWKVIHEDKLSVYANQFYNRNMYPDIVIKNEIEKKVLVFDAKSKSMKFLKGLGSGNIGDLDRNDFFQINTYMSYYQNNEFNIIAGGLLYPINELYNEEKCYSDTWFGNAKTKFIVDGIELKKAKSQKSIICRENRFIERINKLFML